MARPPLVLGTWGSITRKNRGTHFVAYARFRDYDGVTRQVERKGKTGAAAERELVEALRDRSKLPDEEMKPETRVDVLADAWWAELVEKDRAPGTLTNYGRNLKHIRKALGSLIIRELTVPAVDRFLKAITKSSGPTTAQLCRVVLSGMCGLAVRHGAMAANPVRDAGVITKPKGEVKTLGVDAVHIVRGQLRAWDSGKDRGGRERVSDLADPVDMILGTGVRTGEVMSIRWRDVHLDVVPATVDILGTVVFTDGVGYEVQPHPKSETSRRTLRLPPFVVDMLERRKAVALTEFVFASSVDTLRSPNNFRRQWRDFRTAHGYEDWVTPKTFRKAVATLLKEKGSLQIAGDQLGHARLDVTSRHYVQQTHAGPDVADILQLFAS